MSTCIPFKLLGLWTVALGAILCGIQFSHYIDVCSGIALFTAGWLILTYLISMPDNKTQPTRNMYIRKGIWAWPIWAGLVLYLMQQQTLSASNIQFLSIYLLMGYSILSLALATPKIRQKKYFDTGAIVVGVLCLWLSFVWHTRRMHKDAVMVLHICGWILLATGILL